MSRHSLESIFHPKSIAVIGASGSPFSLGYHFVRHLVDYGYSGKIYPVNPKLGEVLGRKVYGSLKEVPGSVDYVICCISASRVMNLLTECSDRNVKAIHLFTGRLSETGRRDAIETENQILEQAKKFDIRLIGPNCAGMYHPKEGISFGYDLPRDPGSVGGFFQSGGAAGEFVRYASLRGVRFSKIISYGNALDLNESDFLQYFSEDSETSVIVSYIEGVKDGRKFQKVLNRVAQMKPVILIKGGRSKAGVRAAASHTAAMAGSLDVWKTAIKQAGAIQAESIEDMIDLVVSFSLIPPIFGDRVGIAGGGGGRSVLSADEWEEAGFNVVPLPDCIRHQIKERSSDIWDWIGNPADRSMMEGSRISTGEILKMMSREKDFDLLIANITDDAPFEKEMWTNTIGEEVKDCIDISSEGKKPIIVVLPTGDLEIKHFEDWRWKFLAEQRACLIDSQVPVFPTFIRAAKAVKRVVDFHQQRRDM